MSEHRALVRTFHGGEYLKPGDTFDFAGDPHWMFEPLDLSTHRIWRATVADADRVVADNWRTRTSVNFDESPGDLADALRSAWAAYSGKSGRHDG